MKVLGIACSGRIGGNTEILVREVLKSATEGGAETELVLAAEKNINPCDGCFTCQKTGICTIQDAVLALLQKMVEGRCHSTGFIGTLRQC